MNIETVKQFILSKREISNSRILDRELPVELADQGILGFVTFDQEVYMMLKNLMELDTTFALEPCDNDEYQYKVYTFIDHIQFSSYVGAKGLALYPELQRLADEYIVFEEYLPFADEEFLSWEDAKHA